MKWIFILLLLPIFSFGQATTSGDILPGDSNIVMKNGKAYLKINIDSLKNALQQVHDSLVSAFANKADTATVKNINKRIDSVKSLTSSIAGNIVKVKNGSGDSTMFTIPPTKINVASKTGILNTSGTVLSDTFAITGISSGAVTLNMSAWLTANGYTSMRLLGAMAFQNPGSATTAPLISVTGWTNTTVSFIIRQQNTAVVSVVGINVLSGLPLIAATDTSTIKVLLSFVAY